MFASTYPWIFIIAISLASFGCNQTVSQRSLPKLSLPKQVSSKEVLPGKALPGKMDTQSFMTRGMRDTNMTHLQEK